MCINVPAKDRHKLENMLGIKIPKGANLEVDYQSITITKEEKTTDTFGKSRIDISRNGKVDVSTFRCVTDGFLCAMPVDQLTTYKQKFISPGRVQRAIAWVLDHQPKFNYVDPPPYPI